MKNDGYLLVVRHGEGRGRIPSYGKSILDSLRAADPDLSSRLRIHHTGGGGWDHTGVRAVVFWLADPLRHYPECLAEAKLIADWAQGQGLPVANPPDALADFGKSKQRTSWREAGLPTPRGATYRTPLEYERLTASLAWPVLVRSDHQHGVGAHYCESPAEARALIGNGVPYPGVAAECVDVRRAWRRSRPMSVWARYHHRRRVYVVGDEVIPGTLYFSSQRMVARPSSTLQDYRDRATYIRKRTRPGKHRALRLALARWGTSHANCLRAERTFLASPADSPAVMVRAARLLGIEFSAIDYALFPDGTPILWELNPYPFIPAPRQTPFSDLRGIPQALERLHAAVGRFFRALLDREPAP